MSSAGAVSYRGFHGGLSSPPRWRPEGGWERREISSLSSCFEEGPGSSPATSCSCGNCSTPSPPWGKNTSSRSVSATAPPPRFFRTGWMSLTRSLSAHRAISSGSPPPPRCFAGASSCCRWRPCRRDSAGPPAMRSCRISSSCLAGRGSLPGGRRRASSSFFSLGAYCGMR